MEETAKNNIENSANNPTDNANLSNSDKKLPFTRQDILLKLWIRSQWISDKIDNNHTKFTEQLDIRVKYAKTECQFYTAILDGLKDVEIDDLAKQLAEIKQTLAAKGVNPQ